MGDGFESFSDLALVQSVLEGNERAFDELFRRYYQMVFRLAYRLSGTQSGAEDIAQDTFVRVARSLRTFGRRAKFSTWLYRIAINVSHDWCAAQMRQFAFETDLQNSSVQQSSSAPTAMDIFAALATLSETERNAVVLTLGEGLSHAEAARILGKSEVTISWHLHRAKKKLKRELE